MRICFWLVIVCASIVACSSGGTYASKCDVACQIPAMDPYTRLCASSDVGSCKMACTTALEGLATACAQCLADHTGWRGTACSNNCEQSFGKDATNSSCGTGSMCAPAMESCTYHVAPIDTSACKAFCAGGG
jgi:hypothetical protein